MKILLLTPDLPYPPESGVALRSFGILRGLREAGHEITLLSFASGEPPGQSNPLAELCQQVQVVPLPSHSRRKRLLKMLTSPQADMQHRLASATFEAALKALLKSENFDLIQFFGIEFGLWLRLIQAHGKGAKLIYDAQNAEADLQHAIALIDRRQPRRWLAALYSSLQARRLWRFESEICRAVDLVVAVSGEDKQKLLQHAGAPIHVVPNGIHVDAYRPPVPSRRERFTLVFSGKMDYRPNADAIEWFCAEILPRVRKKLPQTRLRIVGRNPQARTLALTDKQTQVTGWVESVKPYLHAAALYIVPLRMGSGTRLKILQALASGCTVVSTSIGAAGLHADALATLRVADTAEDFADAVVTLLQDDAARGEISRSARDSVQKHYDWSALLPQLLAAYRSIGLG
ncbi:MAG: glycosyltransferase [Chloroflexi bacterium]|nr:glycosyltransferase [Chloroflexota bacterium]MCY4247950.1 glycosyltransferase [Chloroflexota bacterium]